MFRKVIIGATLSVALLGCEGADQSFEMDSSQTRNRGGEQEVYFDVRGNQPEPNLSKSAPAPGEAVENPTMQSFLAYRYNYGFALPAKEVAPTMSTRRSGYGQNPNGLKHLRIIFNPVLKKPRGI